MKIEKTLLDKCTLSEFVEKYNLTISVYETSSAGDLYYGAVLHNMYHDSWEYNFAAEGRGTTEAEAIDNLRKNISNKSISRYEPSKKFFIKYNKKVSIIKVPFLTSVSEDKNE